MGGGVAHDGDQRSDEQVERLEVLLGRLERTLGVAPVVPRPDIWIVPDGDTEEANDV